MKHDDHVKSTAWSGVCEDCSTTVHVSRHPEAQTDLPDMGEWEKGDIFSSCYVCDGDVQWMGTDTVGSVFR